MQEQTRTRGSQQQNLWSEENEIYYYSNFELFQKHSDAHQFYQYSIFTEELSKELGEDWSQQANNFLKPYSTSREVFLTLMTLWLKHHGPKLQTTLPAPTFQQTFVEEFLAIIQQNIGNKNLKINNVSARALCMGFFLTANDIWVDMFKNDGKQQKSQNSLLMKSVSQTIEKTFRPIMVVRQKIGKILGKKKVKPNNEVNQADISGTEIMFQNCYHEFRKNLDLQKQLERKMNEFSLDENDRSGHKNKVFSTELFRENEAPVRNNILSSMYQYVTRFLNRNSSWQVASSFVTQILEMNQASSHEGTKIKVLRPAEDFYHKLIIVWLSLKGQKTKIDFAGYLKRAKETFGEFWQQKYIIPTKYFFQKISQNWELMQVEANIKNLTDKEILDLLISRIRNKMAEDWQRKIKISNKEK